MMKLGASQPWRETMYSLTGTKEMSTEALREYFSPLESWLKKDNQMHQETVGWEKGKLFLLSYYINILFN